MDVEGAREEVGRAREREGGTRRVDAAEGGGRKAELGLGGGLKVDAGFGGGAMRLESGFRSAVGLDGAGGGNIDCGLRV